MTVMSWNIRGLGKPEKRAAARKLVKKQKISLLLLQETKTSKDIDHVIQEIWGSRRCKFEWVPSEGASGGLIPVWNDDILKMDDVLKNQRELAIKFSCVRGDFTWIGANVYGPNDDSKREDFWASVSDMLF